MALRSGMEWFTASLVVTETGVISGTDSTANITIRDDDKVLVYFDSSAYAATEEDRTVTVTVVADGNFTVPFSVTVTTTAGSAGGKQRMDLLLLFATSALNTPVDYQIMCLFPSMHVC